jgi:hypothetical protein
MVQGGRCVNEQPETYLLKDTEVLDIDISSCYGSAMAGFDYPIGSPTVFLCY